MGQELDPVRERARDEFIVDTDFHLNVSIEELLPYVDDERIVEKLKRLDHPPGTQYWTAAYATNHGGRGLATQGEAHDGEDIRDAMEEVGIDVPIVTPGLNYLPSAHNPRMKTAVCRAYNDYVLDHVVDASPDIRAQAMMPQWDPEAMIEELERIGSEDDIVGAYGWFGPYTPLGAPEYNPVYEKLCELDMPLSLHGSGGYWPRTDPIGQGLRTWTEILGLGWPMHAIMFVGNLIMTGVFDRYPNLRVLVQEGGVNWLPFVAYRLDEFYQDHPEDIQLTERMFDTDRIYLDHLPSEYLFENFYFSTQPITGPPNAKHHKELLDMCHAPNTIAFSSDWPHHTFDIPNWLYTNPHIDEDLRASILRETPEEVFGL
ncbi:amidohydrolase family protein [Natrinema soli]|uniref:Amidohydrolase family protein n=1 Tax=Natrinema soli TaxID=1930624 RepID=A0ABD5SMK3_9EURY|nr:amidohydrolase family protein [Natrinema soli]